jgi:glycine hydroxymethyltransferase
MIPFDPRKPFDPSGLRLGTPSITTRGLKENDVIELGQAIAAIIKTPTPFTKDRVRAMIKEMARKFPLPY